MSRFILFLFIILGFANGVNAQKNKQKTALKKAQKQRIFLHNKLYKELDQDNYNQFKDSIFNFTKDTLIRKDKNTVIWSPLNAIEIQENWIPSIYVFTNAKGNLAIELPNTQSKRYSLFIYDGKILLHNITNLQEDKWIIEKSNFYHQGWYNFELYCNGELLERNKFLLQ
jgi:hypothetical protein